MKVVQNLPNLLTLSNLLMGTIAIHATFSHSFEPVLWLTGGCLLADILDGALARRLGVDSPLGVQLDSLADVVSFGALPAMIIYNFPAYNSDSPFFQYILLILAASVTASAGLRLARFNVDTRPREYFWGLATPAGAIMVVAFGWAVFVKNDFMLHLETLHYLSLTLPIFLIIMYQVPLKLPGLKSPKSGMWTLIVIAVFTVIGFVMIGPIAITGGIFLYVLAGMANVVVKWY